MQAYCLPKIGTPSLDNLEVVVLAAPLPSGDDLVRRLHEVVRARAKRHERAPGEPMELGDEVDCDIVMQVDGRLVPGAIQRTNELELRELPVLPGLIEAMVGMTSFAKKTVELVVSQDHPDRELAGRPAVFHIETRRAYRVEMPPLDDVSALRDADLGDDLEEAMATIAGLLDEEQGEELFAEATEAVLDALAERVEADIPSAAVDEELTLIWRKGPGALLAEKSFPPETTEAAMSDFLSAPAARTQARRNLKVNMALAALVESEQLQPSVKVMDALLQAASLPLDMTVDEIKQALKAEPDQARKAAETALHLTAVEYVMARARINVLDAS